MGRLDQGLSWADFTATWETDVKAGLYWLQAALNLPLKPGSRVLVGSSGAAQKRIAAVGRAMAAAKRMLWFMAAVRPTAVLETRKVPRDPPSRPSCRSKMVGDTGRRQRGRQRPNAGAMGIKRDEVPGRAIRRADAAPGVSARKSCPC